MRIGTSKNIHKMFAFTPYQGDTKVYFHQTSHEEKYLVICTPNEQTKNDNALKN